MVIADHAHIFGIAGSVGVLTSRGSLLSSIFVIALLAKAVGVIFSGHMRASGYAHKGFTLKLATNL